MTANMLYRFPIRYPAPIKTGSGTGKPRALCFLGGWLLAGAAVVGQAVAADEKPAVNATSGKTSQEETLQEAAIPFANQGGVTDWVAEDESTRLRRDRHGHWYRARLMAPASDLLYAGSLSFRVMPSGTLERLDSVVARGRSYPILSLKKR
jgi:hypothetical protein